MNTRPPIVVVLGHVDHGKSSLLEAIREEFNITSKELGGITQHIGAYVAEYNGKPITFIDTPGHEAFSAMRARGTKIADIAILVVAADEGIQPQTKEAIQVIKTAGLPFIVALNKIDKPEAEPERIKNELAREEVFLESLGGKVPSVETSAITKKGIKELLEMILLLADLEEVKTDPQKSGQGFVLESYIDAQRGPAATLLLLNGTLKTGDIVGTQSCFGKVRILENFEGKQGKEAIPSFPVLVIGFEQSPRAGEEFTVFENEEAAKNHVSLRAKEERVFQVIEASEGQKISNLIFKADVAGSLEVLESALLALPQEKVILRIVSSGLGEINENDVRLAQGTKSSVVGFRVKIQKAAEEFAKREKLNVETFEIIYDLIQKVREMMKNSEEALEVQREDLGTLRVLAVFFTEKSKQIIGGRVLEGEAQRGAKIEVMRNESIVGRGKVTNLQKDKKEVSVVSQGQECGISYEGDVAIETGDILQFFV